MNIEEILDDMDDLLDRSRPIPFAAHKAVIDADRMRELLNSAHLNIPAEIKRAKLIDSDCDRIINEAREKAEAMGVSFDEINQTQVVKDILDHAKLTDRHKQILKQQSVKEQDVITTKK